MKFDPNQQEFTSETHFRVWQKGIHIVPPEISLADVTDEKIRAGCMQIYNCMMEIYTDAWNHPDEWSHALILSLDGFWRLTLHGGNRYVKWDETNNRILQNLSRIGFVYDKESIELFNSRYPLFCKAYAEFAHLYKKRKQNMGGYFSALDFRLFAKRMILDFDDFLRPLSDAVQTYFISLREYALSKGMKEDKVNTGFFRYDYNKDRGKNRCLELINNARPWYTPRASVPFGRFENFMEITENQPDADALVEYISEKFNFCDGCAANESSRAREKEKKKCGFYEVEIRGKKVLSCTAGKITTWKYTKQRSVGDADIPMLKRMMDIRMAQIEGYSSQDK